MQNPRVPVPVPHVQDGWANAFSRADLVELNGQLSSAEQRILELEKANMRLELELDQAVELIVAEQKTQLARVPQQMPQDEPEEAHQETELLLRAMRDLGQNLYEYQGRLIVAEAQRVSAEARCHDAEVQLDLLQGEMQPLQQALDEQREETSEALLKVQESEHAASHARALVQQLNESHRELEKQCSDQSKELLLLRELNSHLALQNEQLVPQYEQLRQQYATAPFLHCIIVTFGQVPAAEIPGRCVKRQL
jgi:chromosome segregation ATPase